MQPKLLTFYRVMCGRKAHSRWLPNEPDALDAAVEQRLAGIDRAGRVYLAPLVWIEVGRRASARSRTVPVHDPADLDRLPLRNRPIHPHPAAIVRSSRACRGTAALQRR